MLDHNNIEVMRLQLITLRVVSVDNTIAVTEITSIYTKIQIHGFKMMMLDYNNIEVMCLQLITLRVVSVDNTIAVTEITSIYTKIQKHGFKTTENKL